MLRISNNQNEFIYTLEFEKNKVEVTLSYNNG